MPRKGRPGRWLGSEAKVRSADIVLWLYRKHMEDEFTAREVARAFKISEPDARRRIAVMQVWGAVVGVGFTPSKNGFGRRRRTYGLTLWGQTYGRHRDGGKK